MPIPGYGHATRTNKKRPRPLDEGGAVDV